MANSKRFVVKNGLETQNIQFVELDGTETITLTVLEDGSLSFSGTSGQLFSITDSLTGSIFSVNDISGIPSIEVFDDGKIILAGSTGNVGIGVLTPTQKLDVAGNINISSGSKYKINGVDLSAADVGASASNHTHLLAAGATDVTATAAELNVLDGITATTTELNYTDGVTSNIQTQLDGKLGTSAKAADSNLLDGYDSSVFINETHTSLSATSGLAVGWYTIATNPGDRAIGRFGLRDTNSGQHQSVIFYAAHNFGTDASNTITVLHNSNYAGPPFSNLRIKEGDTYQGAALQVYIQTNNNTATVYLLGDNFQGSGWTLKNFIPDATDPGGVTNYSGFTAKGAVNLANVAQGGIATTGAIYADGDTTQYKVLTTNDGVTLAGAQTITGEKTFTSSLVSNVATGTAPLTVTSTTAVTNLNADLLDGNHASAFALASHSHAISDVTNLQTSLDNKVNTSALGASNGVATLDSNSKLNLSQLPIEALDSLKFYSTVSGDVSDLAKRQTLAAELADAYNLSQGSVVGTYFIINAAGTISGVTGIQVVSGDYTGTYVTLSFRNQDSSATQGNANSGALEIGDWFVIEQISGSGTLASPLVFVASVISNTYEDATTAIKGITQLSSSTSTATTGNNVITDGILNGLVGDTSTKLGRGDYAKAGYDHSQITGGTNPHNTTFANIASKPTTVSGYGITDAVTTSGDQTIAGNKTFTGNLILSNTDITGINNLTITDPGPNEGISWAAGNLWKIYESPNDLTTNSAGNLQIVQNATRRATFNTSGQLDIPVATGTSPLVIASTTAVTNLNADRVDSLHTSEIMSLGSVSDFADGTLVVTSLDAAAAVGPSWTIEVVGKGYGLNPIFFIAEGYNYNDTFINTAGYNYGTSSITSIKVLNYNNNLAFWWPRLSYWNSFDVKVTETSASGVRANKVTSITNATEPVVSKKVTITLIQDVNSSNIASQTVATAGAVSKTVTGTSSAELVRGNMADNDQFRILVGGTATNAGYAEIATADDGTEPIYVRQYTGLFTSLTRTATLLDGSGNTSFPGTVTGTRLISNIATGTSPLSVTSTTVNTNLNADMVDGLHSTSLSKRVDLSGQVQTTSYRKSVIALCELTNTNPSANSYSIGMITFHRTNGLVAPVLMQIAMEKRYNVVGGNYTSFVQAGDSFGDNVQYIKFQYNGIWYGGIEFFFDNAELSEVTFHGESNFAIFGLDYYNTQTSTVINSEVNSSITTTDMTAENDLFLNNRIVPVLTTGGNLGIGTTSPDSKLAIQMTGTTASGYTSASNAIIKLDSGTSTNSVINLVGGGELGIYHSNSSGAYDVGVGFGTNADRILRFDTGSAERMRILANGNVGIGTSTPTVIAYGRELTVSGASIAEPEAFINIQGNRTSDNNVGGITFNNLVSGTNSNIASIAGRRTGANNSGRLIFNTTNAGTGSEKMTILPNGNVGIGTTSPTELLHLRSATPTQLIENSGGTGILKFTSGGNINYIQSGLVPTTGSQAPLYFSNYNGANIRMVISGDGNVGIGTTNPLNINGFKTLAISGTSTGALFDLMAGSTRLGALYADTNATILSSVANIPLILQTNDTERMRITNTGNVGIGTNNPGVNLHIKNESSDAGILLQTTTSQYAYLNYQNNANRVFSLGMGGSSETAFGIANKLYLYNSNTNSMNLVVDENGKLGLGTTSPQEMLDIYKSTNAGYGGTLRLSNNGSAVANKTAIIFNDSATNSTNLRGAIVVETEGDPNYYGKLLFKNGSANSIAGLTDRMVIAGNGNVGIGETNPSSNLDVVGSLGTMKVTSSLTTGGNQPTFTFVHSGNNAFVLKGGSDLQFLTDGGANERLRIANNGNVGIGTASPATLLHTLSTTNNFTTIESSSTGNHFVGVALKTATKAYELAVGANGSSASFANNFYIWDATSSVARLTVASGGNVGIGTSSPASLLHIGSGTSAVASPTAIELDRSFRTTVGGNMSLKFYLFRNTASNESYGFGLNNEAGVEYHAGVDGGSAVNTRHSFYVHNVERMRIGGTGLVGINETSPSAQLQVKSGATNRVPLIVDIVASNTANLQEWKKNGTTVSQIDANGSLQAPYVYNLTNINNGYINFPNNGALIGRNIADTNPALIVNQVHASSTGDILKVQAAGTDRLTVKQDGKVGIGTTTPTSILQIAKSSAGTGAGDYPNIRLDNANASGYTGLYFYQGATQKAGLELKNDVGALTFYTGTTEKMRILSGGNVGIGTTAAASLLSIGGQGETGALSVQGIAVNGNIANFRDFEGENILTLSGTLTSNNFVAKIGDHTGIQNSTYIGIEDGSNKIYFMSDAAVGVGTTNPTAKLDVNGDVKHTGLTMTTGTNVDQTKSTTLTSALTTAWTDVTGVSGTYLATGSYIVQILSNGEYYTGEMSWFSGTTTTTVSDEIILHRAGPAASAARIFARVTRTSSAPSTLKLQVSASTTVSSHTLTFKFRRTI